METTKMAVNRSNTRQTAHHYNRKVLNCKTCGKACVGRGNLKIHERVHTGEKPFKCSYCDKCFSQTGNLQRHERTHTGEKPFVCEQCGKRFSAKRDVRRHKAKHVREDRLIRNQDVTIKVTTIETANMSQNVSSGSQTAAFCGKNTLICSICGRACIGRGNLRNHMRVHTGEKPFKCSYCDRRFSQTGNLQRHERTHTGEKPFKCKHCGKRFSARRDLWRHKAKHEREDRLNCNQSKNGVTTTNTENTSQTAHHYNRKVLNCKFCGKACVSGNLKLHERVHTGEKPFKCRYCDKRFNQVGNLHRHERMHTGEKPFKCELCGGCYSDARQLRSHMRKTHPEKSFSNKSKDEAVMTASVGGEIRSFQSLDHAGNQKKHKLTRSRKKCFKCSYCGKCFDQSGGLRRHERTHTGEKPFKCGQCGKGYSDDRYRREHESLHTEKNLFCSDQERVHSEEQHEEFRSIDEECMYDGEEITFSICELLSNIREIKQE